MAFEESTPKRHHKLNPVPPLERIFIGPEDLAYVFSLSSSKVSELRQRGIIPPRHVHFDTLPRWYVPKLLDECRALIGQAQDSDHDWSPET